MIAAGWDQVIVGLIPAQALVQNKMADNPNRVSQFKGEYVLVFILSFVSRTDLVFINDRLIILIG